MYWIHEAIVAATDRRDRSPVVNAQGVQAPEIKLIFDFSNW